MSSPVSNYYDKKERKALITGATGFVGLALIEKLLRCFPSITLYLLIRSKYEKDAASRWEDLKLHPVCRVFLTINKLRLINNDNVNVYQ